jgi:predicted dehydrogenase
LQPTNGPIPYIYCEKPVATSSDEIRWLEANISFFSKKLKIGFNLLYSDFVIETSRLIQNKSIGKPLSIFFQTSHGLAGKNNFGSNWRAHDPNPFSQLIGNLAIHHVHVCHYLFGEVDKFLLTESNAFNARNPDTISLLLHHESGVQSHIFCSYATICFKRFSVYFTDGLLEHSDEGLVMRSPRNFSNSAGEFATPPKNVVSEHSVYSDATLYQSITNFLEKVMTGEGLGEGNVRSAIAASKIVLEIISKTRHPSRRNPLINPD